MRGAWRPDSDTCGRGERASGRTAPYLCTDATEVLVQVKERCRHGHFFVVLAPEWHVLFRYSASHDGKAVDRMW